MIEVPDMVRQKAAHLGEPGERWLANLPDRLVEVAAAWDLTLGRPFTGGSASYTTRARTADGEDVVLKLVAPGLDTASQVRTIAAADGNGYVRLLAHADDALLLEALGPELDLPPEQSIAVLARLLRQAWLPPAEPAQAKADGLGAFVEELWHKNNGPTSRHAFDEAMRCAERRTAADDPSTHVVVHGDPHPGNALRVLTPRAGAETGYAFVDPEGFVTDPAYDLGVVLRDWCDELLAAPDPRALARRYSALLAEHSGLSEAAVWEWGFLERMSTGLYLLDFAGPAAAAPFLRTADLLAGATLSA
ncbi:MAG: aminoglycoside phosphotransferase family protein [Umezawaea sp.]